MLDQIRLHANHRAPEWLKTELRLRSKYRRMRVGDVGGYSFLPYDKYRCVFIHIPKTAGVSVAKALFGNLGGGHIPIQTLRRIFGAKTLAQYFKFSFIRNPFDRVVSAYLFLRGGGMDADDKFFADREIKRFPTFPDFVKGWVTARNVQRSLHFTPQVDWLRLDRDPLAVDFLGRYEYLERDFATVCSRLRVPGRLPHYNATNTRKDYRLYYDAESIRIIENVYQQDLELLGYDFQGASADLDRNGKIFLRAPRVPGHSR